MNQTSAECCGQLSERCQGWSTKVKLSHWRKASSNPRFVHKSGSQMVCRPCRDAFQEVLKVPEVLVRAPEVVATEQRQGRSAQAKPVRTLRTERPEPLKKRQSHTELLACGYRGDRHNEPNMLWLQQRPEAMDDALLLGAVSMKKKHADIDAAAEQEEFWNNGDAVSREFLAYKLWFDPKRAKLLGALKNHHTFIRSYHK